MNTAAMTTVLKSLTLGVLLLFVATACSLLPPGTFAVEPRVTPSPEPPTVCEAGADLAVAVQALRDTELSETSVLGLLVSVDIAIDDARQFGAVVGETYGPLASDLVASLEGLKVTLEAMGDQPTLGAEIASAGESMVEIGNAMDALAVQIRTPCPTATPA